MGKADRSGMQAFNNLPMAENFPLLNLRSPMLVVAFLLAVATVLPSKTQANESDQAFRLGAFAGAMRYCEDRHDGPERRFRWARLRAFEEVSAMRRSDRFRALAARERVLERGRFLGEPLNARACLQLLRLSEWQRFRNF